MACGILVPRPGIEPASPALEGRFFYHWTTREVPVFVSNIYLFFWLRQVLVAARGIFFFFLSCCMRDLAP